MPVEFKPVYGEDVDENPGGISISEAEEQVWVHLMSGLLGGPGDSNVTDCAREADEAVVEWRKRFVGIEK